MQPRRRAIFLLAVSALLAATAAAPARADGARGTLRVSFAGTSTLHDFEGTAGSVAVSLSQAADGTWSADVGVPVAEMKTGNGWRDENMRKMFDAEHHPLIRGRFRGVDPQQVQRSGVLPFALTIRTVERPVQAAVSRWEQNEQEASFDATFELSLASFQLEAPKSMFLSVGDSVRVTVHVTLERV